MADPVEDGTDGFFVALFERTSAAGDKQSKNKGGKVSSKGTENGENAPKSSKKSKKIQKS